MFNGNSVSTLSFNQQVSDDTMFEQLYQFQQNRDGISTTSTASSK